MAEVSAGRILIMAVGNYNAATPYEPLDLVAYNDESWLCRKACTGVTPTSQASEYWQKFGSAVGIATLTNTGVVRPDGASIKIIADGTISVPTATGEALGLVKPDGTTITIDANGALSAQAVGALNDLTDVNISSATQGQILQYNVANHKWENVTKQFLTELEQMLDVDIDNSTLADGQALIYDVATGKWQNKAIAQYPKLDTVEQVMANTQSGKVVDALAIKAMNTAAVKKFSDSTYVTVDSIAYDETNQVLGLKVNGADTVIPFKKGNLEQIVKASNQVFISDNVGDSFMTVGRGYVRAKGTRVIAGFGRLVTANNTYGFYVIGKELSDFDASSSTWTMPSPSLITLPSGNTIYFQCISNGGYTPTSQYPTVLTIDGVSHTLYSTEHSSWNVSATGENKVLYMLAESLLYG